MQNVSTGPRAFSVGISWAYYHWRTCNFSTASGGSVVPTPPAGLGRRFVLEALPASEHTVLFWVTFHQPPTPAVSGDRRPAAGNLPPSWSRRWSRVGLVVTVYWSTTSDADPAPSCGYRSRSWCRRTHHGEVCNSSAPSGGLGLRDGGIVSEAIACLSCQRQYYCRSYRIQ